MGTVGRKVEWCFFLVILAVAMASRHLWPGDTGWINDEPYLFLSAANMLSGAGLATKGLVGSLGFTYGPVPIWIFAGFLRLTDDLVTVATLRTALFDLILAASLIWLAASSRRLRVVAGSLLVLSPYAWIYSRVVWDNPWITPLGALGLAAYISFCASPARYKAWIACLALFLVVHIHPMSVPLVLAVGIHGYLTQRDWLRTQLWTLAAIAAVCLLIQLPWLLATLHIISGHAAQVAIGPAPQLQLPKEPPAAWYASSIFGLFGGRHFSALGFDYFLEPGWTRDNPWLRGAVLFSVIAYGLVWYGAVRCVLRVRAAGGLFVRQRGPDHDLDSVCLLAFVIGCVFLAALGRHTHPHYYNGNWIVYGYFIWSAVSERSTKRSFTWLLQGAGAALAVALIFSTVSAALRVHRLGGTRGIHFGATLGNQIEVARVLGRSSPDAPLSIEVKNWLLFPHSLTILRRLTHTEGDPHGPTAPITVRYRDIDPDSGWIIATPGGPQQPAGPK